ncbi:hypothetical protein O6H91_06G028700 [Diphasiastrum complanatum]|uniref:Uncharacterized protein n=1 Tax=Diphasiastrum complanatum TaxID=34168 RepID=A0ACC2DCD7_DIPCM|nr:hypothetical protein O6H91_06G028700 [Diphasiastrum complanatum]
MYCSSYYCCRLCLTSNQVQAEKSQPQHNLMIVNMNQSNFFQDIASEFKVHSRLFIHYQSHPMLSFNSNQVRIDKCHFNSIEDPTIDIFPQKFTTMNHLSTNLNLKKRLYCIRNLD